MKNNLEVLEEIMKPYFDKKKEIESAPIVLENEKSTYASKIHDLKTERISKRKELEDELENLKARSKVVIEDYKEKMNREIEEYISKAMDTNSNFFAGYGSMLRKDLEQEYSKKLKELEASFKEKEQAMIAEINSLKIVSEDEKNEKQALDLLDKKTDYSKVDLRELFEIKGNLRKQLIAEQKRLNFELKQQQINFDSAMLKLDAFKYEYNDQQQVINGAEWRKIYESSNEISDKMNEIRNALKKVEEYLNLTEPTKEETAAVMMSMTHWEKAEYDRRKDISSNSDGEYNNNYDDLIDETRKIDEDMVEINDPVISKYEEKDGNIVVDDMENLLKTIYNEVVKEAMKLNSVKISESKEKLGKDEYYISSKKDDEDYKVNGTVNFSNDESIKLPCGEYINSDDINEALKNLFNKTKGRTYIVKETGKEYKISRLTVEKLKQKLKKCSTIKLVKEKKISKLDLLKVFGKQKSDSIVKEVEIGQLKDSKLAEGDYINRNELIANLDNLFTNKKLDWLRNFSDTLKSKKDSFLDKFKKKSKEEDYILELDDDFYLKQK